MLAIVDYGMGNVQSVRNAFEFLGARVILTSDPNELERAERVVLPGVGAFASGMKNLNERGLSAPLRRMAGKKPFLGICLGMQLLASEGDEGGPTEGLDVIPGRVRRLNETGLRIPHVGWNEARTAAPNALFASDPPTDYYFVHSYCLEPASAADTLATADYGQIFACAVGSDKRRLYGVQFHPEKSHGHGLRLLKRFLELPC